MQRYLGLWFYGEKTKVVLPTKTYTILVSVELSSFACCINMLILHTDLEFPIGPLL
jgi:hypothetical protein